MSEYKTIVLQSRPKGEIVPEEVFKTVTKPIPQESELKDDQVLIQTLYLSLDPAMRGWLNDGRSYMPPVALNDTMRSDGIGRVLASKSSTFASGDLVTSPTGWTEYAIMPAGDVQKVDIPPNGKTTDAMGVLGLTGLTAYFGLLDIGQPKARDTVVVSGAAGATGSVVCQIAKLKGCRVIGLAGSADKVAWLKELGCDIALDYKGPNFEAQFTDATPDYIDVFYDNVGGEILNLALSRAKMFSRFVMCGAISQYNSTKPLGPSNIMMVIGMRIKMQGFIVFDFAERFAEARKELAGWLAEGKIQRKEHVLKGGIEEAPKGLLELFKGTNTGKLLVEVKAEN